MVLASFVLGILTIGLPAILRALDTNGDNLDDAWEAHYGITTGAYSSQNLVGWWQLDGPDNVVDRSPNHIAGTLENFSTNAFGPGLFSNALYFTPQAYVGFAAHVALNTPGGMTFSAWIKSPDNATNEATVATWVDAKTNSWSVGIDPKGIAAITFADATRHEQTVGPTTNSATLYDGQWHHLAATWAPDRTARVYVDGENQDSGVVTNWTPGSVVSFSFGVSDDSATNQAFTMDEVRLYNRALGPNEVTQLPVTYTDFNGNGLSVLEDYQRGLSPVAAYTGMAIASTNALPLATGEPGSSEFTPWMSTPDMKKFLSQFDTDPPGGHPNYWDKGHWLNAIEGRWHNNRSEFRITYGPVPKHKGSWWYWYWGISESYFNRLAKEKAADGFTLLDANSFTDPKGHRYFQGVWHKITLPLSPAEQKASDTGKYGF